jgi:serine/threonine protein kinase/Tfp pilus assembly protein PilF
MPPQTPLSNDASEKPGDTIGPYKILELIGEGGFGRVYLAERREPMVQRVAIKIIKPGMDSRSVIARFEQERQALAVMDHPNVAKVLDGGMTPIVSASGGRPYFVMEHVKGEPITVFCDRQRLTISQRLELFATVCDAVQHAHMKGIIHRDIKPSNILVAPVKEGPTPIVKVIDFGVAKAISHILTENTIFTERGQLIGTPEYMSPEQAEMGATDIDTRADVYSLGVLLYELLSGTLPFDSRSLRAAGYAEIQRIIREEEAPRPSTKLSTTDDVTGAAIANARQVGREKIASELRRELEWIPLKALRKDRSRRYASAEALGVDVRRYLKGEPLEAAPESRLYLGRKFVRRNSGQVIATGAVFATLVLGLAGTVWQAREAARQRDESESRRAESDRIASYLRSPLDKLFDTDWKTDGLRNAEDAAQEIAGMKDTDNLSEAEFNAVSLAALAMTQFEALQSSRDAEKQRADELKQISEFQSRMLGEIDTTQVGEDLMKDVHERFVAAIVDEEVSEPQRAAQARTLADLLSRINATDTAAAMIDRTILKPAVKAIDDRFKAQPVVDARLRQALSDLYETIGLYDAALPLAESALATFRRVLGREHPETLISVSNMGVLLRDLGRLAEAEEMNKEALATRRRVLGEEHPETLTSINNLAGLLQAQGKLDKAEAYYKEAMEKRQRVLGAEHPDTLSSINNMGVLFEARGQYVEAESYWREALAGYRRTLGDEHPNTISCINNMGALLDAQGKYADAEPYYKEALEKRRRLLGEEHPSTLVSINNMGYLLVAQGRLAEAEPYYKEALEKRRRVLGDEHPHTLSSINNMGFLLEAQGMPDKAERYYLEDVEKSIRLIGKENPDTLVSINNLGRVLVLQGKLDEGERYIRDALDTRRRVLGENHTHTLISINEMSVLLLARKNHQEAIALLIPAEPAARVAFTAGNARRLAAFLTSLGRARVGLGWYGGDEAERFVLAEANLLEAHSIFLAATSRGPRHKETLGCVQAIVDLYTAWHAAVPGKGYDAKAAEWRAVNGGAKQ